ncbi:ectoine/hydroxyectoine ABC transporter permease subunit EhuD [Fodinisporobacter ferrooxydans]|uniref:Ectoine/hydroxyectoine ABC transporter permease subunit EhuD n=1 Tax=Fodinisporobacter ferrooxydans TaxID=2901836 RepID=A0ABY4CPI7_9BACL|nr:ectoine/hydroxyectoine ABC transporter permease subunit EhuD [Alicyclobacillaceae bacterium MYW30-H2]
MWDWNFAISILPKLLQAMLITLSAAICSFLLSVIVGLLFALGRRSKFKPLARTIGGIVEFIRSTPLLVQLFFIFYVLPNYSITLSPFTAGVIGLGLHYSTYLSEVYRSGIDAIPKGQWEAGKALNFSPLQIWFRIILPQAIPPVIPVFGNYLIVMFKDTPLLSAITVVEMMQTAKIIGSESFRYLEPFTIVGVLFFVLSFPSALLVRKLEGRLNKNTRKENMTKDARKEVAINEPTAKFESNSV